MVDTTITTTTIQSTTSDIRVVPVLLVDFYGEPEDLTDELLPQFKQQLLVSTLSRYNPAQSLSTNANITVYQSTQDGIHARIAFDDGSIDAVAAKAMQESIDSTALLVVIGSKTFLSRSAQVVFTASRTNFAADIPPTLSTIFPVVDEEETVDSTQPLITRSTIWIFALFGFTSILFLVCFLIQCRRQQASFGQNKKLIATLEGIDGHLTSPVPGSAAANGLDELEHSEDWVIKNFGVSPFPFKDIDSQPSTPRRASGLTKHFTNASGASETDNPLFALFHEADDDDIAEFDGTQFRREKDDVLYDVEKSNLRNHRRGHAHNIFRDSCVETAESVSRMSMRSTDTLSGISWTPMARLGESMKHDSSYASCHDILANQIDIGLFQNLDNMSEADDDLGLEYDDRIYDRPYATKTVDDVGESDLDGHNNHITANGIDIGEFADSEVDYDVACL